MHPAVYCLKNKTKQKQNIKYHFKFSRTIGDELLVKVQNFVLIYDSRTLVLLKFFGFTDKLHRNDYIIS